VSTQWEQQQQLQNGSPPWDIHRLACCCARRVGNMHLLLSSRDGSPLVIAGPCWPFCLFVTVPLIVGVVGLVGYFFIIYDYFSLVSLVVVVVGSMHKRTRLVSIYILMACLLLLYQPMWILYIYVPAVVSVLVFLFCVSCRDPGLMERVTVSHDPNDWIDREDGLANSPTGRHAHTHYILIQISQPGRRSR
jgi:hypothetical protein